MDWEATWHLIRAFIESGEVRYVFLSRQRQISLYKAALSCGATPEELEPIIQYPRTEKVGIVRHSPGHTGHIHVRFIAAASMSSAASTVDAPAAHGGGRRRDVCVGK